VINPASKNKRSYWTNDTVQNDANEWMAGALEQKGSWWGDWTNWLRQFSDGERTARTKPGSAKYKPIEAAPGRYVKELA
jgi:polyhydroxyalkanoate synthase